MYIKSIKHLNNIVPSDILNANLFSVEISGVTTILDKDILCDFFDNLYDVYLKACDDLDRKKEVLISLSSVILKKKYGNSYKKYMQYFIDNAYIRQILKGITGVRCSKYKLVEGRINKTGLTYYVNSSTKLLTKQNRISNNPDYSNFPYSIQMLDTILENLKVVTIQKQNAIDRKSVVLGNSVDHGGGRLI